MTLPRPTLSPVSPVPSLFLPTAVRFEYFNGDADVLGIGTASPRLSWQMPLAAAGFVQVSYEIEIERSGAIDTFAVDSAEQVLVPWPAAPLKSRERVSVRVRVRDRSDSWSGWSEPVRAEAGLLDPTDWTAHFVSPRDIGGLDQPAPVLSAEFSVPEGAVSARLYSTAHGIYVADLNGRRVSEDQFAPGWTAYDARLRYQVYDVTSLVAPGRNVLTALLGNGWYRGRLGYLGDRAVYGDRLAFLAQLEITMASGDVITIATDAHWRQRRERHPRGRLLQRPDDRPAASVHAHRHARCRRHRDRSLTAGCGGRATGPGDPGPSRATGLAITVWSHAGGLRPERRRPRAVARPRIDRRTADRHPPRGGARERRARHAAPARC